MLQALTDEALLHFVGKVAAESDSVVSQLQATNADHARELPGVEITMMD